MKLKTIAKLFGAVVEDDYGSPQRDATLPGWFRWYLDHMPVRENVYGTLIDIGLTGTQANVIIERIWPQIASIQQEAIDLAKAGNESGAIAKLNEAASLAERLAREAAKHERLLGRGIEPEPSRLMEERDMAAQAEKADWPRQVVERDNYILINDYLGAGYAQANPELVETLVRIASDYLLARPDVAFDNLWAYTYDALKKMYPARERGIEVGGGTIPKQLRTAIEADGGGRTPEQHFGRIYPLPEKKDWPSEVVERDRYIIINDWMGAGFAEAHPELVTVLKEAAANHLAIHPDIDFDDLGAYVYEVLKAIWPPEKRILPWKPIETKNEKTGGGMMEASSIAKMFGAGEQRTYEQHFERVAPDAGGVGEPRIDWAEKWELIWEPKLEEPLSQYIKELVDKVWKTFEGLDIKVSGEAFMTWGIESAEDARVTILEKVGNDLYRLFSEADFEEGRLPIWGPALARKYVAEYETEIMDKSTQWWERVTGTKVGAKTESKKTGGGIMPKRLSLRSILMAAASLGDLLSLLRKVKDPDKEVSAAIKKLEGMVAKYDEGAKLEDVNTAAMKRILANLKKVPKPTKDQPRTRVLRAVKLLEDLLKTKVSSAVLQASIVQVARILKAVEEPTEEVKDAIKLADQLAKSYEEGGPKKYGKVVSVEGMTKLLKMLEAIEEKPDPVVKAVAALKKLLGAEEEKPVAPGERGVLPSYGLAKLEAAIKPGVYRVRLIRAGEAQDGTTWPEEQLKIAFKKKLFEGVPVNAISYTGQYGPDIEYHLPLDTELAGKIVGNQVGFIQDTSWDDEDHAGYGYAYITETERRNLIDALLEQKAAGADIELPGMSIYADGMKDENDIVTGINGVTSMDLVTFPAADGAILSQALTASVKEWGEMRKKLRTAVVEDGDEAPPALPEKEYEHPPFAERATAYSKIWEAERIKALQDPEHDADVYELPFLIYQVSPYVDKKMQALGLTWADVYYDPGKFESELDTRIHGQLDSPSWYRDQNLDANALWEKITSWIDQELARIKTQKEEKERKRPVKTGGGIMSPTALEQRLDMVEKISQGLNERVAQADTDGMIELKLQASKLPDKVQVALRGQLLGKQLTEEEVDSFIKFQQGITDDLATELAATAHVTLGGGVLPGEGKDTLEGALTALFEKQK